MRCSHATAPSRWTRGPSPRPSWTAASTSQAPGSCRRGRRPQVQLAILQRPRSLGASSCVLRPPFKKRRSILQDCHTWQSLYQERLSWALCLGSCRADPEAAGGRHRLLAAQHGRAEQRMGHQDRRQAQAGCRGWLCHGHSAPAPDCNSDRFGSGCSASCMRPRRLQSPCPPVACSRSTKVASNGCFSVPQERGLCSAAGGGGRAPRRRRTRQWSSRSPRAAALQVGWAHACV